MMQQRKEPRTNSYGPDAPGVPAGPEAAPLDRSRPLSARSVIASTLLGVDPPRLPGRLLVRSGELFGISEGTTRVALSRMTVAGELSPVDGSYHLQGRLLARHARQLASRRADRGAWTREWVIAVVVAEHRTAAERASLREATRQSRLGELREGVWMRPDNLAEAIPQSAAAVIDSQCRRFVGAPMEGEAELARSLWDLNEWAEDADSLRTQMDEFIGALESNETAVLAPAFVLSASVLRHLLADPLMPEELLPASWPGRALRVHYDHFDSHFKRVWREWFGDQS